MATSERRSLVARCRRWRWVWRRTWGTLEVDLRNVNRLYVQVDEDRPRRWVAISYGNGNSDPVFMLEIHR